MAELADAHASEACGRKLVEVQILSSAQMKIVEAKIEDVPDVFKLFVKVISQTKYYSEEARVGEISKYSEDNIRRLIDSQNNLVFVAKDKSEKINGFLFGHYRDSEFFGDWLAVESENRQIGVATHLVNFLFGELRSKNIERMIVHTRINNTESINLLLKLGFQKSGLVEKNWYGGDSLVWVKTL